MRSHPGLPCGTWGVRARASGPAGGDQDKGTREGTLLEEFVPPRTFSVLHQQICCKYKVGPGKAQESAGCLRSHLVSEIWREENALRGTRRNCAGDMQGGLQAAGAEPRWKGRWRLAWQCPGRGIIRASSPVGQRLCRKPVLMFTRRSTVCSVWVDLGGD